MTLFNSEEVNTGRQWGLDFAKTMSIVFMVLVHTFIYVYGEDNMNQGFQYRLNNIYGGTLAAPVFMFCMGVGVAYSRRSDAKTMFQRGLKLILAGYLLNIIRCLPQLILWKTGQGDIHYGLFQEELNLFDILQFAGVAFLLFALLRTLKASPTVILLVGIALSVFGTFVRSIDMGSMSMNLLCYPFVGIHVGDIWTSFPLANWFIFVAAGHWLGRLIRRCNDIDRFYALVAPIAGFVYCASILYMEHRSLGMFSDENDDFFYYLTTIDAFICIMGALMLAGAGHFLIPHEPKVIRDEVKQVSADVTRIYLIHWFFVSWLEGGILMGLFRIPFNDILVMLMSLVFLALSIWLARCKPFTFIKI